MTSSGSPFTPASSLAQPIAHLFIVVGIVMAAILLLVTVLVTYASFRFRHRPGSREPQQWFGNRRIEIAWTVAPLLLLLYIFTITVHAMRRSDPGVSEKREPDMVIVGHQWWWEARYLNSGAVAANEIHIPVGKLFLVRLEAADVIHDWWVPQLGRKMDAIPGRPNLFWLEADYPGTYLGTCAEYCGAEHAWMRIRVIAEPAAEFERWTAQQLAVPSVASLTGDAKSGASLFQKLTCQNCHAISGLTPSISIGPDLTHIASRETLAGGVLINTQENLAKWLSNPQAVKPESFMPNFELTDDQVRELSAYLETLQ
jgi:cytochrome c oxidase subunit 2